MRRVVGGFEHSTPWVEEMLSQFAIGSEVEVRIMQRRSLPQLQLYWVILHLCVSNSEDKYGRAEDLHDALKIALGYSRRVPVIGGNEVIILPGSISFGKMTQGDFKVYFDRAMAQLDAAGYPVIEYLKEAEKQVAKYKPQTSYRRGNNEERVRSPEGRDRGPEVIWDETEEAA